MGYSAAARTRADWIVTALAAFLAVVVLIVAYVIIHLALHALDPVG